MKNRYDRKRFNKKWLLDEGKRRLFTCAQIDEFCVQVEEFVKTGYTDDQARRFAFDLLFV
jgi:protein involved in temperature-dependent protein secretion